jgi:glycosyltransferase involved in cell wall biosynthesis
MIPDPEVLVIEGSDFETFPVGGQLTMVRGLMKLFGNKLALVGMNRDNSPTGRWMQKEISGTPYLFFSVSHREASSKRPFIPARLAFYAALSRFKREILSLGCKDVFLQAPEALLAVCHWNWDSICYWFPGVENPLKTSRYPIARPLWRLYDKALFSALDRASVILAAADENAIRSLVSRSNGRLSRERLTQLPTCVDTSVFRPAAADCVRMNLGIPSNATVFVTPGRVSHFKGWELLLTAFEQVLRRDHNAFLFFVGDGEDRSLLEAQIELRGLASRVKVTGFQSPKQVAACMNAADVVVFGSFVEGWSVAMLEALACGKPIVSTRVSGVRDIIRLGENGFIVESRDHLEFASAMEKALCLTDAGRVSLGIASRFELKGMGETLAQVWPPFRINAA